MLKLGEDQILVLLAFLLPTVRQRIEFFLEELKQIEEELDALTHRWKQEGKENKYLVFSKFKHPRESLLVEAYEQHPDCAGRFKTLRSLRDVDKNSDLYLVRPR